MLEKLLRRTVNIDEELHSLRNKVKHLEDVEFDNSKLVENEEIQPGKKRKRVVESWFAKIQDIKKALEKIETEVKDNGPSNDLKEGIKKLTKEVDELIQQGKFPTGVVLDDHASTRLPLVIAELVGQSCSENIASVLSWLKEDDVFAIGLYGMGGVGKTTLIEHVHNKLLDLQDSEIGGKVYMVIASQECSLQKLQIKIGNAIGFKDFSQYDEGRRKAILFARFTNLCKSVLIIDDLWKHYLAEEIGIPLKSCKIVLTSRSFEVCKRMNCQQTIKIVPLTKPNSMKLFNDSLEVAVPEELKKVAEEIVDECGGLPLALKTMGCCMRGNNDVLDWQNALCELRAPVIRNEFMEERVFQVLKYSYNNLKDETTKHCFLSCVLFPEDEKLRREDLVRLWIYEGLLDETESEKDKENRGYSILNRLEKLCLLESVTNSTNYVKMHDLVRDLAIIITQDRPRFMARSGTNMEKMPEKEYWSKDLVKVGLSVNRIREIPSDLAPMTTELKVLFLENNPLEKIPESFFVHMRALTVLNLSETRIESLPESVCKIENLRALLLFACENLNHVPALDKLVNLRILDLTGTSIKRLPESVSNLENLRELLLSNCSELTYVPSLARLTNLRELDLLGNWELKRTKGIEGLKQLEKLPYCPWNVNDMSGFCRFFNSLTSLCCYRFLLAPGVRVYNPIENCDILDEDAMTLCISGAEFGEDEIVSELLLANLKELIIEYSEMKGRRILGDVFSSLGKATNLTRLEIRECRGLEYITTSMWAPFDTLEYLHLEELPDLRRIVEYGGCSFSMLEHLCIKYCPKIKEVFPFLLTSHEISLPNLQHIEVIDCEEVEQIFPSNNATPLIPNPVLVFKELELIDLPKLESIYKGVLFLTCNVNILNCPNLNVLEGENIICDASSATLASIKSENAKGWWDDLQQKYPQAAASLSDLINTPEILSQDEREEKDDDRSKWGAYLSLSLPV